MVFAGILKTIIEKSKKNENLSKKPENSKII